LIAALAFGHPKIARDLIARQVDIQQGNRHGFTPLFYAAGNGDDDIVKLLLEKGAVVNACPASGYTSLKATAEAGYADTVQRLLAHGADVNALDHHGNSALLGSVLFRCFVFRGVSWSEHVNCQGKKGLRGIRAS